MCGYTCARSFVFLLSVVFSLVGGGLLGVGIYGLIHEVAYGEHFLDQFYKNAPALEDEFKGRILLYFVVVTSICVGLGALMLIAGIATLFSACKNFKSRTRYGNVVSTLSGFVCWVVFILIISGLVAAFTLYVGISGTNEEEKEKEDSNETTKSPDYKINWKLWDLGEAADQIYNDLVKFCWKIGLQSEEESEYFVTNTLYLTGGVSCAVVVLLVVWLIVGCCFSCGEPPLDVDYIYVSSEKKKYDDWITNDRRKTAS